VIRLVTASSLFDGHDASINIMRRLWQSQGCEVVHLGHNRSVHEVVAAAIEEDVHGVAVSSYQGGHVEYFEYLVDSLRAHGAGHVKVVGGGGGVIVPAEIARLRRWGVTIFSPEDGQRMGLLGMIRSVMADCEADLWASGPVEAEAVLAGDRVALARAITGAETGQLPAAMLARLRTAAAARTIPVLGVTGHRWLGQIVPCGRTAAAAAGRPAGQATRRGACDRPDPA
jgi:methylmalonyl-CoA mutase